MFAAYAAAIAAIDVCRCAPPRVASGDKTAAVTAPLRSRLQRRNNQELAIRADVEWRFGVDIEQVQHRRINHERVPRTFVNTHIYDNRTDAFHPRQ